MASQTLGSTMLRQKLRRGVVYESIAVLATPYGEQHVTPLGITLTVNGLLRARIYPGTRLPGIASSSVWVCLSLPCTPEGFYDAVEGKPRLARARLLPVMCPDYPGLHVEAVVARRERWIENGLIVVFSPVHAESKNCCQPYSREMGCSIEVLIDYTRAVYWATRNPPLCERALSYFNSARATLEKCLTHVSPTTAQRAQQLLEKLSSVLAENRCPAP